MKSIWVIDEKRQAGYQFITPAVMSAAFLLLMPLLFGACAEDEEDSFSFAPPVALYFVTPSIIPDGIETPVTWRWTYVAAPSSEPVCSINHGVGVVTSGSSSNITINGDTTFTLTCENTEGRATSTVAVNAITPGTVWGWGWNEYYQLGDGYSLSNYSEPVQAVGLEEAIAISGGYIFSMALTRERKVIAWGYNAFGSLGKGTFSSYEFAEEVLGLNNVVAISAGATHALALLADGTVVAWGGNAYGQLGDGSTEDKSSPVPVQELSDIVMIATSFYHSLALQANGTIWAWGHNGEGQLGTRTTTSALSPVQVQDRYTREPFGRVVSITSCWRSSYAIKADGTVWAWGLNNGGQIGDGTQHNRLTPVAVKGLQGSPLAITSGRLHALVVTTDKDVWGWGWNTEGQLGDVIRINFYSPVPFNMPSTGAVKKIASGLKHTLLFREDGTLWSCGLNEAGQLGDGTIENRDALVPVHGLIDVSAVSAGYYHSLAIVKP